MAKRHFKLLIPCMVIMESKETFDRVNEVSHLLGVISLLSDPCIQSM